MTGIERLLDWVGTLRLSGLVWADEMADELESTVDLIKREHAEDCYKMGLDYGAVSRVVTDMERHCLGHEGMEDSPVARWVRELRGALKSDASDGSEAQNPSCVDTAETADATSEAKKVTRDPAEDASMSAYDLLPADERDAIAWVRERGGLDYVKKEWRSRVPHDRYVRRRQSLLGHIAECETALGRRNERIEKMGKTIEFYQLNNSNFRHLLADVAERLGFTRFGNDYEPCDLIDSLDRRLMPEGCEWPRYEDGEPVNLGDRYGCWCGKTHVVGSISVRKGCSVLNASDKAHTFVVSDGLFTSHGERVKRPAVLTADGEPLEAGQTVYNVGSSEERVVDHIEYEGGGTPNVYYADGGWDYPDLITHQRPDSWERVEKDAGKSACTYFCHSDVTQPPNCGHDVRSCRVDMTEDLVRRCRALAERERGE